LKRKRKEGIKREGKMERKKKKLLIKYNFVDMFRRKT
jgi:hypothetical protein